MTSVHDDRIRSIMTSIRATANVHDALNAQDGRAGARFVTISNPAGADARTLATELTIALNAHRRRNTEPWCAWDQELVDRVAAEHQIRSDFIEALENADRSWFGELLSGLSQTDPGEFKVYRRVAMTISALAQAGRAVIVGRGGVFITAGLRGGLHVQLVAPLSHRIERLAKDMNLSHHDAVERVQELDRNRLAFYRRHWPKENFAAPETFTVTFNTARLTIPQMVASLLPLIVNDSGAHLTTTHSGPMDSHALVNK